MNLEEIAHGFGPRLKDLLKKKSITQSKFGEDIDFHKGLISRYLKGEKPSGEFILKTVSYFPEEIQFLFFGTVTNLVQENSAVYSTKTARKIEKIEVLLQEIKTDLSQK